MCNQLLLSGTTPAARQRRAPPQGSSSGWSYFSPWRSPDRRERGKPARRASPAKAGRRRRGGATAVDPEPEAEGDKSKSLRSLDLDRRAACRGGGPRRDRAALPPRRPRRRRQAHATRVRSPREASTAEGQEEEARASSADDALRLTSAFTGRWSEACCGKRAAMRLEREQRVPRPHPHAVERDHRPARRKGPLRGRASESACIQRSGRPSEQPLVDVPRTMTRSQIGVLSSFRICFT